jgi:hypothetical protein
MKRVQKLRKKYGKLTVRSETMTGSRRAATVQCSCGYVKTVLVDSLVSGSTRSCGRGACKQYARVKKDKNFKPRPPRACTARVVRLAWDRYHHAQPWMRLSLEQLSVKHGVHKQTLTSLFRSVRRCGGIDRYMKLVSA